MNKRLKFFLEIVVGIGIILFILSKVNLSQVIEILSSLNYKWVLLAIFIHCIFLFLTSYILKVLFDSVKVFKFIEWARYYFMGFSMGLVLPGRTGDLSIIYFVKDKGFSIGQSTALTIIDKAITLTIFGIISCFGLLTILKTEEIIYGGIVVLALISGALFTFTKTGRRIIRKIIGKYAGSFTGFHRTFKNLFLKHKKKLAINIIITLIRPIGNGLILVLLFQAIGLEISLIYGILISSITLIASLAPLTPNGLGVREGIGIYLFHKINVVPEATISVYLIILLLNYVTAIVGVTHYFLRKKY